MGTKVMFASVYHPQSNGAIERANGIIFTAIKKWLFDQKKREMGRWTPEGHLVSQYHWMQSHQVHTIQTSLRSRRYEPRRAQAQKPQITKQYWTFDRGRSNWDGHLTSFGQSTYLPGRNPKVEKQESRWQIYLRRGLGPEEKTKFRNHRKTTVQMGWPIPSPLFQQTRILPSHRSRRKWAATSMECYKQP